MNANVHPVFAAILQSAVSAPADARAIQIETYQHLLRRHDWSYDHSDDMRVYRRGKDERGQLEMIRRELDADRAIWNSIAPAAYRLVHA